MRPFSSIARTSVMFCALLNAASHTGFAQGVSSPPASTHHTVHVTKGDTIVPSFAITTDSILKVAGFDVRATALGQSRFIVRWRVRGVLRAVDTLNFIVDSSSATVPPDTTVIKPPPPAIVASVQTSLGLSTLTLGQTTQAIFAAKDSSGAVIAGRTVLWSSLNANVASVTPFGLVTAMGIGGTSIRATVDGRSGDAAVVVNPPTIPTPPTPGHPNEPVNMTQLSPLLTGDVAPPSTWTSLGWVGAGITTTIDTVPGYGQTNVLNINYPPGQGNGSAPGRAWTQYSAIFQDWQTPVKTLYLSYWYKVSPNFPLSLNANKMMYGQVNHANSAVIMLNASSDQGTEYTAPMHPRIILQNIKSAAGNATISQVFDNFNVTILRGTWFHVEALLVANTAGQSDGYAKIFVDGALAINVPNVAWDVSGVTGLWDTLLWDPVYNLAVPADAVGAYHRLKDLYVSGKP